MATVRVALAPRRDDHPLTDLTFMRSEHLGDEGGGAGGAISGHGEVVDWPPDFIDDRRRDLVEVGRAVVHGAAGAVPVEAVRDVALLLEVAC
jgi:hypothetical protein